MVSNPLLTSYIIARFVWMFWLLRVGEEKDERFSFQDLTTPGAFWQGDDDESNMNRKKNALSSLTTQRLVNAYRVGVPLAR